MTLRLRWVALGMLGAGMVLGAAAAEPPAAGEYEDRVLDAGPQPGPEPTAVEQTGGWPRGGSAELQSSRQSGATATRNESLRLNGFIDTPNYGAFSADLNLNRFRNPIADPGAAGAAPDRFSLSYRDANTGRIDQRAMPFPNGWFANNSIGHISTAGTPLSRGSGRVYLPSLPIEGISTTFERPDRTSLNASFGRPGYFDGLDSQGFSIGRGTAATFGAQQQLSGDIGPLGLGRTDAAFQWLETRNFNLNGLTQNPQDTQSFWFATSWQGVAPWADTLAPGIGNVAERPGGLRMQANVAHSAGKPSDVFSNAPRDSANGAWIDATWRSDWLQQVATVFRFDPALRWGSNPIAADLQGVAWRGDVSTRRWQVGGSAELSESVSGLQGSSLFGNLFGRYRFDSRNAASATLAARTGTFAAQSLQLTWERISSWGQSQWRADASHGANEQVLRLGVDHAWDLGESRTLASSLAIEQQDRPDETRRAVNWGLLGSLPFAAGARVDLSVRGTQGLAGNGNRFLNANARVSWPIGAGWSFVAQYSAARGRESLNPAVVSALTSATLPPVLVVPSSRSVLLALRWEARAGSSSAPIGGAPGTGAGRLEGHVFFDHDNNGQREASEAGVPNVTVVLNKRFVVRTDAQGYYGFPSVAAGKHEIELIPDNLPLPWSTAGSPSRWVDVYVRDTTAADFAIQKDR